MDRRDFLLGTLAATVAPAAARAASRWIRLGSRTVRWNVSRDNIHVPRGLGPVSELQFRVRNGSILLTNATVHFASGQPERLVLHEHVRSVLHSHIQRLRQGPAEIRRVEFWYRRSRATTMPSTILELYGRA